MWFHTNSSSFLYSLCAKWSRTIKIIIMATEWLRDLKNVSRVSYIHLFIFIEVSVWTATKIDLYPMLLKVQHPDFSKRGLMLLRISNVLLIHPPFIDVLVQICPFYFCHFARRHRCLFEGVGACVCVCACVCLEASSIYFLYRVSRSQQKGAVMVIIFFFLFLVIWVWCQCIEEGKTDLSLG